MATEAVNGFGSFHGGVRIMKLRTIGSENL